MIERASEGHGTDLKEYTIGAEVFHRGADFDPRVDSIVRVQIGVLRKKLAAYYEGPGNGDEIVITVPKGRYAPEVRLNSIPELHVAGPVLTRPEPRRRGAWPLIAAGVLVGALGAAAALRISPAPQTVQRAAVQFEWRDHPLWKGFFNPKGSTRLVVGVPFMLEVDGLFVRDTQVNRPEDIAGSTMLRFLPGASAGKFHSTEIYTGVGEAEGISVLTRFFGSASQDLSLTRNRLTKWRDLADGNLVLLSSLRFRTLGTELDRPNDFQFVGIPRTDPSLHNVHPQPGEASDYVSKMGEDSGIDYALVTVWRGTMPGRRIMAVGGTHTWGTEGAAEYITDGPSLRELLEKTGQNYPPGKTGLQVLVKVEVRDSQVASTSYVTHHWLP